MRILVATNHLERTGGTESYTYALINELKKRGHDVEYFTFNKGEVADRIEFLGVKFRFHILYDLILANHNSIVNHLYKRGYIIQTCHGTISELEQPSKKANHYVAITQEVYDYLRAKNIQSTIIYNGIDCNRFFPKKSVSAQLKNVLSLCQSNSANAIIEKSCAKLGLSFEKIDKFIENIWDVEDSINNADLVIGIGRSLYDAMACGRPVISFDSRDYSQNLGDGYLTQKTIQQSILYNCSGRFSKKHFNANSLAKELKKFNTNDGYFFRNYAITHLNIKKSVDEYLKLAPKHLLLWKLKKIFVILGRDFYWGVKLLFTKFHFSA